MYIQWNWNLSNMDILRAKEIVLIGVMFNLYSNHVCLIVHVRTYYYTLETISATAHAVTALQTQLQIAGVLRT